jgi:hypothetical protein
MKRFRPQLFFLSLLLLAAILLACGTSGPRTLQSITVSPATADGQVQFVATGHYTNQPPVTPLNAYWGACYQNAPTDGVTISKSGSAQCSSGASGTYSVFASLPTNCNVITACGGGCQISGYATLTCP